jgi:hypothetical protein
METKIDILLCAAAALVDRNKVRGRKRRGK